MTGFEEVGDLLRGYGWPFEDDGKGGWLEEVKVGAFRLPPSPLRNDLRIGRCVLDARLGWAALLVDCGARKIDRWTIRGLAHPYARAYARSFEEFDRFPLDRVLVLVRDADSLWAAHQEGERAMGSRMAVVPFGEAPLRWRDRHEWADLWERVPHERRERRQDRRRFPDRFYRRHSEALADLVSLVKAKPRLTLNESRVAMAQMVRGSATAQERLFWSQAEAAIALATRFWLRHPEVRAPLEDVIAPVLTTLWAKLGQADETRASDPRYLWTWVHRTLSRSLLDERRPVSVPAYVEERYARQRAWLAAGQDGEIGRRIDLGASRFLWSMEFEDRWTDVDDDIPATGDPYAAVDEAMWVGALMRDALRRGETPCADRFTERHHTVLLLRYGLHPEHGGVALEQEEIGHLLGISREWARQLEAEALRRLRTHATGGEGPERPAIQEGPPVSEEPPPQRLMVQVEAARRGCPAMIEVKELLSIFGAKGRGVHVVASINARLERMNVVCAPPIDHPGLSLAHSVAILAKSATPHEARGGTA